MAMVRQAARRGAEVNSLITFESSSPAVFTEVLELANDFAKAAKSAATQRAYSSDINIFVEWCRSHGLNPLPAPPAMVGAFLADQAALGKRPSMLGRRLAAIRYFHRAANESSPTSEESVKAVLAGIRRTVGAAPVRKKAATSDIVIAMAADTKSLRALRNRAVLLLGFAGAFRRSELVALNVEDLEETPEGLLITIRRGKTDQEGLGRNVALGDVRDRSTQRVSPDEASSRSHRREVPTTEIWTVHFGF